jgi:hypothetical protein
MCSGFRRGGPAILLLLGLAFHAASPAGDEARAQTRSKPRMTPSTAPDAVARRAFASADRNRDGNLDYEEVAAARPRSAAKPGWPAALLQASDLALRAPVAPEDEAARLYAAFEDLDRNVDDRLDYGEWQAPGLEGPSYACLRRAGTDCIVAHQDTGALRRLDWSVRRYYRFNGGIAEAGALAVRDPRTWTRLWPRILEGHSPRPPVPAVDFGRDMLLVAALGTKPSGGHAIRFESVRATGDALTAWVVRIAPGRTCGTTAALTAPVDIVRAPRSARPIRWVFRDVTRSCD